MKEIDPVIAEPQMPRGADGNAYVQASLFEGWDPIYEWINQYWKKNTVPSPDLVKKAEELVKGLNSHEDKVAALYHWIQKNIRYVIIKGDVSTTFGSYPAHETVKKQFGCCVDKAMVFSAMLNAVGIENGPLLINVMSHHMSKRIPNLGITHSISRITRENGERYYLDSTNYDFRYPAHPSMNQGRYVLDPFRKSFDFVPMQRPEENIRVVTATMSLALNGDLQVSLRKDYSGEMEAYTRGYMKSMKPEERKRFFTRRVNGYGRGATLIDLTMHNLEEIEKPYYYDQEYKIPDYPTPVSNLRIFRVPGLMEALSFPEAAMATRSFPIEYDSTEMQEEKGIISLEKGLKVRSLPEPVIEKNANFEFTGKYQQIDNQTIAFSMEFKRIGKLVKVEDFASFKAAVQKVEQFGRERIFLIAEKGGTK